MHSLSAQTLPAVLTRAEVGRLFEVIREERFRVVLRLIYACGLRVGEAAGPTGSGRSLFGMAAESCPDLGIVSEEYSGANIERPDPVDIPALTGDFFFSSLPSFPRPKLRGKIFQIRLGKVPLPDSGFVSTNLARRTCAHPGRRFCVHGNQKRHTQFE